MKPKITFIPGDGVGPDVTAALRQCIAATGVMIEWDEQLAGTAAIEQFGTPVPEPLIESIKNNKIIFKGPLETPVGTGFRSVNIHLRQQFDLFASVRPSKNLDGLPTVFPNTDIVVIRENTEDLYAGIEFECGADETLELIQYLNQKQAKELRDDVAISIKALSISGSYRILKFAFEHALRHHRESVTVVHKANIMKHTDGLFLRIAEEVAEEYKGRVMFKSIIVDNLCMQLVQEPQQFDVLVLPNLYGDIVSDLCAGLVGGLGVVPSANYGEEVALFEPAHGSVPRLAGTGKANPTATILSGIMMLRHIDETAAADRLEWALHEVVRAGQHVTVDLKDDHEQHLAVSTATMADAVCQKMEEID